jgi:hypothetical protein
MSLIEARQAHYNNVKKQTNKILNKYKHYKFFEAVFRELNDPAFFIKECDDTHDKSYDIDEHDIAELRRMENLLNNMRKWEEGILPDNHANLVADLSDLLQAIKISNPHTDFLKQSTESVGSIHVGTFGKKDKSVNYGGNKRTNKRTNKHGKKHSKKNRRRSTTCRSRSKARR